MEGTDRETSNRRFLRVRTRTVRSGQTPAFIVFEGAMREGGRFFGCTDMLLCALMPRRIPVTPPQAIGPCRRATALGTTCLGVAHLDAAGRSQRRGQSTRARGQHDSRADPPSPHAAGRARPKPWPSPLPAGTPQGDKRRGEPSHRPPAPRRRYQKAASRDTKGGTLE